MILMTGGQGAMSLIQISIKSADPPANDHTAIGQSHQVMAVILQVVSDSESLLVCCVQSLHLRSRDSMTTSSSFGKLASFEYTELVAVAYVELAS